MIFSRYWLKLRSLPSLLWKKIRILKMKICPNHDNPQARNLLILTQEIRKPFSKKSVKLKLNVFPFEYRFLWSINYMLDSLSFFNSSPPVSDKLPSPKMPIENMEEEGLAKIPDLRIAQRKFQLQSVERFQVGL